MLLSAPSSSTEIHWNEQLLVKDRSETSCELIHWLARWGLDPLLPKHGGKTLLLSIFELKEPWETKCQILQYVVANEEEFNREVSRIYGYPLVAAIQSGNEGLVEFLIAEGEDINAIDKQYSLIKFLINWMEFHNEKASIKILQLLKKNKATLKEKLLIDSLEKASENFIAELFQGQTIVWTRKKALECLSKVQEREEELIWETLKNAGWPFQTLVNEKGKGILSIAIEERNLKLVQWILRQTGFNVLETDITAAWDSGDLEILECLLSSEKILKHLRDSPTFFLDQFQNFFLFSKFEKIQKYLLPIENKQLYHDTLRQTALIGRYTKKQAILNLSAQYGIDVGFYAKKQGDYGRFFHQVVQQKLLDLKSGERDLFQMISDFAKARYQVAIERMDPAAREYLEFRIQGGETVDLETSFQDHPRYLFAFPWMKQMLWQMDSEEIKREDYSYGYTLFYNDPKTLKKHPLTLCSLDGKKWLHTNAAVTAELWPVLQQMHEELLEMRVDTESAFQMQEFQNKLATAYWLGCQLIAVCRGNAQYFLMWLSCILQFHNCDPLLAKKETPQPDCLALGLPLSEFVKAFPSFYENPLFNLTPSNSP